MHSSDRVLPPHPPARVLRHVAGVVAACACLTAAGGCLGAGTDGVLVTPDQVCAPVGGMWVLVSRAFGPRILLLDIGLDTPVTVHERPSVDAAGGIGRTLAGDSLQVTTDCASFEVRGVLAGSGAPFQLDVTAVSDTASGQIAVQGASTDAVFGVRFDSSLLREQLAVPAPTALADSTPVLLVRVDDATSADRDFLPHLVARGLTAELAVPTALAGRPEFLTWSEVQEWSSRGFGIAAHSRWHSSATTPGFEFLGEVVGSFADLASHGLRTAGFVQPGSWQDSLYFDSPDKLANWRGALLRNFSDVFQAYASPNQVPTGVLGVVPLGVTHTTVSDAATVPTILTAWRRLFVKGRYTVFLMHSRTVVPPDKLDWLLDSIAVARQAGRLRLVSSSEQLVGSAH